MQPMNSFLLIVIIVIIGGVLWLKVRHKPRQINLIAYAALTIWVLSLLVAFILELSKS